MSTDFDASKALSYGIRVRFRNENGGGVQNPKKTEVQSPVMFEVFCANNETLSCRQATVLYGRATYRHQNIAVSYMDNHTACRSLAMSEGTVVVRV